MGHRYYDTRIGRFITQDPAGDGDNWYAYAGNNPVNATDPDGLEIIFDPSKADQRWQKEWNDVSANYRNGIEGTYDDYVNGKYTGTEYVGPSFTSFLDSLPVYAPPPGSPGVGMIAGNNQLGPKGTLYRTDMKEPGGPDMHIYHDGDIHGPETNIDQSGRMRTGLHRGRLLKELPEKLREPYRPFIETFLKKCGMGAALIQDTLEGKVGDIPMVFFYTPNLNYKGSKNNPVRNTGG